eukprot:scaffold4534_cov42-Isochrysis_galbana.AAC.1
MRRNTAGSVRPREEEEGGELTSARVCVKGGVKHGGEWSARRVNPLPLLTFISPVLPRRPVLCCHVGRVVGEADSRCHHITVNVSAASVGVGSNVCDGCDDRLEVALEHAVKLEGLSGGGAQIALT